MKPHVLICGRRNSGKTELTEKLLQAYSGPVYGFRTKITHTDSSGYHQIYMFPAEAGEEKMGAENHIGDCDTVRRTVHTEVFDTLGVQLLREAKPDGLLLMDELGFMEKDAAAFCREVLACMDADIPVLATAKARGGIETDFLQTLRSHPKLEAYTVTPENRDALYEELLPWILAQNERKQEC